MLLLLLHGAGQEHVIGGGTEDVSVCRAVPDTVSAPSSAAAVASSSGAGVAVVMVAVVVLVVVTPWLLQPLLPHPASSTAPVAPSLIHI